MAHASDCPYFDTRFPWDCGCQGKSNESRVARAAIAGLGDISSTLRCVANDEWWAIHVPGQVVSYGAWEISFNPPPIPFRGWDWQFCHKDFDGAPDACDDRYGAEATLEAAMDWIDDWEGERFDEHGCQHGCRLAFADPQCLAIECKHRDELRQRIAARKATPSDTKGAA